MRESEKVINVGEREKMGLIFEQVLRDGPSKFGCMQNFALVARNLKYSKDLTISIHLLMEKKNTKSNFIPKHFILLCFIVFFF